MITTRNDQSIYDLTEEFLEAVKKMKSGGEDADNLCRYYAELEKHETTANNRQALEAALCPMGQDIRKIDFIIRLDLKVTDTCLAYFNTLSRGNPMMVTTFLGFYGLAFYKDHSANEYLDLRWIFDLIGKGKFITYDQLFWWYAATKTKEGKSIFDLITPEEFYRYDHQK